jgi:ribosomal protein L7/L12
MPASLSLSEAASASAAGQLLRVRSSTEPEYKNVGEPLSTQKQTRWAFASKPKKLPLKKQVAEVVEPLEENVNWGSKSVPGPFDVKTLSTDTASPKTSHKDVINDYPPKTTKKPAKESLRGTKIDLVFHPRMIEGSYDPATRTADVIIIETGMGNRRDRHYYGDDTLRDAVATQVFDGAQAYADHPSAFEETDRPERSVRDQIGYYFGSHLTTSARGQLAIAAKLKIQEGQDWVIGLIKESIAYAKRFPTKTYAGISINADGDVEPGNVNGADVNYVHRITDVFSADLVTKPARGGKFLALVESARGAQGATMKNSKKLLEAAAKLKSQVKDGYVDPADLAALTALVEAECATKESAGADDGVTNAKEADAGKGAEVVVKTEGDDADDDNADDNTDDNADDNTDDSKVKESGKKPFPGAAAPFGKVTESQVATRERKISESDVSKVHPSLYSAALKEARTLVEADTKSTIDDLRKKLAEATAKLSLRESFATAQSKLKASDLPDSAAARLLESIVGRTPDEMDRLIETESKYLSDIGFTKQGKKVEGNRERVTVRESEVNVNASAIFAGLGE